MKIKELPVMERPYEKLEEHGAESLSNAELLAIIIKTGTKDYTSVQIAQDLLKEDIEKKGITFLNEMSIEELVLKKGIGRVKAIQLKAIAELALRANKPIKIIKQKILTPEDVSKILMPSLKNEKQEIIKTILLDAQNQIIKIVTNAIGGLSSSQIEAREIFREPIKVGASKIILVHNHPSGNLKPSPEDIRLTKQIREASNFMRIKILDHIIISDTEYYSFADEGIL